METYWKHGCSLGASGYPKFRTGKERRRNEMRGGEKRKLREKSGKRIRRK